MASQNVQTQMQNPEYAAVKNIVENFLNEIYPKIVEEIANNLVEQWFVNKYKDVEPPYNNSLVLSESVKNEVSSLYGKLGKEVKVQSYSDIVSDNNLSKQILESFRNQGLYLPSIEKEKVEKVHEFIGMLEKDYYSEMEKFLKEGKEIPNFVNVLPSLIEDAYNRMNNEGKELISPIYKEVKEFKENGKDNNLLAIPYRGGFLLYGKKVEEIEDDEGNKNKKVDLVPYRLVYEIPFIKAVNENGEEFYKLIKDEKENKLSGIYDNYLSYKEKTKNNLANDIPFLLSSFLGYLAKNNVLNIGEDGGNNVENNGKEFYFTRLKFPFELTEKLEKTVKKAENVESKLDELINQMDNIISNSKTLKMAYLI